MQPMILPATAAPEAAPRRERLPRFTDRLRLGTTNLRVSPFCIGITEPPTVSAAYDAGINFFFVTADMHWPLYEGTRRGLCDLLQRGGGVRDDIVVASVCYVAQPEFTHVPFEEVIESVPGLGRIDVLTIGGAYSHDLLMRLQTFAANRQGAVAGGRAIGCTFHDRHAAAQIAGRDLLDISFVRYNAFHTGPRTELFPFIRQRTTPVFNFKSCTGWVNPDRFALGDDYWRPSFADHYRFALTRPELDGVLCAPSTPAQVEAMAEAMEAGPLDDEEQQYLVDLCDLTAGKVELAR